MCNARIGLLLSLFCIGSFARGQTTQPGKPCIAVVASFPEELQAIETVLQLDLSQQSAESINGVEFRSIDIGRMRCLFFVTGMSLVNASMNTQLAVDHFDISAVLFTGIAGGVDPALGPGDVVVPERWHYHSETAYFNETSPGQFKLADYFRPKYGHFGMILPDDVTVKRDAEAHWKQQSNFDADPQLLTLAKTTTQKLPPMRFGDRDCKTIVGGDGVSGTVFCDNAEYRRFVFNTWHAECLDMESTAIAHVCWQNRKPCLIVRGLSDLAGGEAGKNTVDTHLRVAADHAATVLAAILREMSQSAP